MCILGYNSAYNLVSPLSLLHLSKIDVMSDQPWMISVTLNMRQPATVHGMIEDLIFKQSSIAVFPLFVNSTLHEA